MNRAKLQRLVRSHYNSLGGGQPAMHPHGPPVAAGRASQATAQSIRPSTNGSIEICCVSDGSVEIDAQAMEETMQIHYLEIVTQEVDATCATYAQLHGVKFSEGDPGLGNARTAALASGGMIGVRAPMHASEEPVVRPYVLVKDIDAAIAVAEQAGGEIALPPMEIPGHGKFAIYIQGGIHHGLWQV